MKAHSIYGSMSDPKGRLTVNNKLAFGEITGSSTYKSSAVFVLLGTMLPEYIGIVTIIILSWLLLHQPLPLTWLYY